MIGRGTIVVKRGKDKNELHFVSPWELALATYRKGPDGNERNMEDVKERIKAQALAWKPDDTVGDAELEAIQQASRPDSKSDHKYASDIVFIVEAEAEEAGADPLHRSHQRPEELGQVPPHAV